MDLESIFLLIFLISLDLIALNYSNSLKLGDNHHYIILDQMADENEYLGPGDYRKLIENGELL